MRSGKAKPVTRVCEGCGRTFSTMLLSDTCNACIIADRRRQDIIFAPSRHSDEERRHVRLVPEDWEGDE